MSETVPLSFPPLFESLAVIGTRDPFDVAQAQAARGCDGGLVVHSAQANRLRAAIVFAPEVPLESALTMLPVSALGLQNALGALAPPEVAVQLGWDGDVLVNGATCGGFKMASATHDPKQVPDWLVIGLEIAVFDLTADPGVTPEKTTLHAEGCADVEPERLLESWVRHTLVWINRWEDEGSEPIHDQWLGLVPAVGEEITVGEKTGVFLGVDDKFGLLLRGETSTDLVPLSTLLAGD